MAGIQPPADDSRRDRGGRLPRAAVRLEGRRDRGGDRAGARPEHLQLHLLARRPAAALAAAAVSPGRPALSPPDRRRGPPVSRFFQGLSPGYPPHRRPRPRPPPRPPGFRGRPSPRAPAGGLFLDVALRATAAIRRACSVAVPPWGDGPTKRFCPAMNGRWSRTHGGRSMTKRKGIDRREFVTTTGAAVAAAALGPTIWIPRAQKTLKILQWSHFVPSYDVWFDKYAKDWGTAKGIDVTVDHIALADLGTRANAEVAAQQGHDLFQFLP